MITKILYFQTIHILLNLKEKKLEHIIYPIYQIHKMNNHHIQEQKHSTIITIIF